MADHPNEHQEESPLDPVHAEFRDNYLWVTLRDQRVIGLPLMHFPWLLNASPTDRDDFSLLAETILWDKLDEALDTEEMLIGYRQPAPSTGQEWF